MTPITPEVRASVVEYFAQQGKEARPDHPDYYKARCAAYARAAELLEADGKASEVRTEPALRVARVDLNPGDAVALMVDRHITAPQRADLASYVSTALGVTRVVVLDPGISLAVIGPGQSVQVPQ
jgi:hypothetical protein